MYCQMLEGDSWKDAKMDKAKIDKMSGMFWLPLHEALLIGLQINKSASYMSL